MKHPDRFDLARYPVVAYTEAIKDAKRIEEKLISYGIPSVSQSRIAKYRKVLEDFVDMSAPNNRRRTFSVPLLLQALFEISQMTVIVDGLMNPPVSSAWASRIAELVSGHLLPQTEIGKSKSRDIQFELFIAASCHRAGFSVEPKEPDVLVRDGLGSFGIAVKRPKSQKTLERHIRKGSQQVLRTGTNGLLAIDLSLIHNPRNEIQLTGTREESVKAVQKVANRFVELNCVRIRSLVKTPNVFGVIACMSGLFFIEQTFQFALASRWTITNLSEMSDPLYARLRRFAIRIADSISR